MTTEPIEIPTQTETPRPVSLYRKLAAVAGSIGAVEKDGRNQDQKYRYPTPASVMSAVKPLLNEYKLAIVPHLVEFTEIDTQQRSQGGKPFMLNRVSMHYHILDGETGDELVVPWQAQAGTYGDDKGLAKAQTIALRTFLIQLFQIPAEDPETDPDAKDARLSGDRFAPPQRTAQPRPPQTNGASYEPAAQRAANGQKRQLTIAELASAIRALWQEERDLGGQTPPDEVVLDLETLDRARLVELGKTARARVLALQPRKGAVPLADVPEPPQAKAA